MGDMGELFNDLKVVRKGDRERRLALAKAAEMPGWTMHTEYHWSRIIAGQKLDWWPSRNKWSYGKKGNKPVIHIGTQQDLLNFIKNRMIEEIEPKTDLIVESKVGKIIPDDDSVPWD